MADPKLFSTKQMHLFEAAMLLEGEGTFSISWARGYLQLSVRCSMTDIEPLNNLQKWLGGKLNGPYEDKRGYKPVWEWKLATRRNVVRLITEIKPFLSARRQRQIQKMLIMHRTYPLRQQVTHGMRSMYNHYGCRCNLCKEANTNHFKIYRSKRFVQAS